MHAADSPLRGFVACVSLLLCWAGVARADDDLAGIAAVMEAREVATRPYRVEYSVELTWGGTVDWNTTYSGSFAEDSQQSVRRLVTYVPRSNRPCDRSAGVDDFIRTETILVHTRQFDLDLRRRLGKEPSPWTGEILPRSAQDRNFTPSNFGLVFLGR